MLAICSGSDAEVQKVLLQYVDGRSVYFIAVEDIAHLFAQPEQLSQAAGRARFGIGDCEVKQLEHSLKGFFEARLVSALKSGCRSLELASDISQLLHDGKREPSAFSKTLVERAAHCTSEFTISQISILMSASSTERDRLPNLGRMLISESNSIHSDLGLLG